MRDLLPHVEDLVRILTADPAAHIASGPDITERDGQYGRLALVLRYDDGSTLQVWLWADCSADVPKWPSYRFHYQDRGGRLRFRHDNAPHYRELPNFPHHLHVGPDEERVMPFGPPTVREV